MSKKCNEKNGSCAKKTSIGGQALIEGIMMRGPKVTAMAVRDPQGQIVLEKWETPAGSRSKLAKLPIIRGVLGFINSMRFGYKCLMRSAEISGLEELNEEIEAEKRAKKAKKEAAKGMNAPEEPSDTVREESLGMAETETLARESQAETESLRDEQTVGTEKPEVKEVSDAKKEEKEEKKEKKKQENAEKKESSALMTVVMLIASVLGVVLAIGLFIMLPSFLYNLIVGWVPFLPLANPALDSLVKSAFEGILKIMILVIYMLAVRLMKDIKRTFQYHGAEHKTIFCYEHGKELTVANVREEQRFHPRCGTSFLILMLLVGIFVGFFIDPLFTLIFGDNFPLEGWAYTAVRAVVKLLLLPVIMGLGYELIKLAGRHDNWFTRIISAPGKLMQRITVLEPTDDMIECAIAAFQEVIPEDNSDQY